MAHRSTQFDQSGVIAFRGPPEAMEMVLVTSRRGKRWVIPKGLVEPHLAPGSSAAKEAFEEAGLLGEISQEPVGHYHYEKWGQRCQVAVYLLRVEEVLESWPEARTRTRVWLSHSRAAERIDEPALASLIRAAPQLVSNVSWETASWYRAPKKQAKKR